MPLRIEDHGENNKFIIADKFANKHTGSVNFRGSNNTVVIGRNFQSDRCILELGENSKIVIGHDVRFNNANAWAIKDSTITIGDGTGFSWSANIYAHEPCDITIGERCLFADKVWMTVSDMHSILDRRSGKRLNPAKPIVIGDDVWIGEAVAIMKGSTIGNGSVIGACAVVAGKIPPECLAVGIPAKVVRKGISWDRKLI